jgi:hypothetical protein
MGSRDIWGAHGGTYTSDDDRVVPIPHAPRGELHLNTQNLPTQELRTTAPWSPPTARIDVVLRRR